MKKLSLVAIFLAFCGTANSAVWYAKVAGNWDGANAWNSQRDGLGTDATHPLTTTDSADLNNKAMNLNVDVEISSVIAGGAAGQVTVVSSHSITGNIHYGGTLTTGMFVIPTGTFMTVFGMVLTTGTGYGAVTAGASGITVSSSGAGGIALMNTGTGRSISPGGTGWFVVQGSVSVSGGGYGIFSSASSSTNTVTGYVTNNNTNGAAIRASAGTITIDGNMSSLTTPAQVVNCVGATVVWTGARTHSAGESLSLIVNTGTLNLSSLVLSNSGSVAIQKAGGTLNVGSGGTLTQINLMTDSAQAAVIGQVADIVNPFSAGGAGGSFTFAQ